MERRKFAKILVVIIATLSTIISIHFLKDIFFSFGNGIKKRRYIGTTDSIINKLQTSPNSFYLDLKNKILFFGGSEIKKNTVSIKQVKAYSLVCPHLGCTLSPESTNKYLVCPCHGSRFKFLSADSKKGQQIGKLINGPANRNINQFELLNIDGKVYLEN